MRKFMSWALALLISAPLPAQAAAQRDGLAGDYAGGGGAVVHGVRVHHPRHGLGVGVDVRGGNILVRADDDADLAGVAPCDALEFRARIVARVETDATLGAAKGQVDRSSLDGHPGRQGHDFRQRDVLVVAHAALARAARYVVLHAVAFEVSDGAVVKFDRNVHDQHTLGSLERLYPFGLPAQIGGDPFHLFQIDAPGAHMVWIQIGRKSVREFVF